MKIITTYERTPVSHQTCSCCKDMETYVDVKEGKVVLKGTDIQAKATPCCGCPVNYVAIYKDELPQ